MRHSNVLARAATTLVTTSAALLFGTATSAAAQTLNRYGNPESVSPRPTAPAISETDLMTRLYQFAHDSMTGRQFGREGNMKGTAYIASELKRLGVEPGGDNGTYFQRLPVFLRRFSERSTLTVNGRALAWGVDWVASAGRVPPRPISSVQAIYGGIVGDSVATITPGQAAGKLVVLTMPAQPAAAPGGFGGRGGGAGRLSAAAAVARFPDAAGFATIDMAALTPAQLANIMNPSQGTPDQGPAPAPGPLTLRITPQAAAALLGGPVEGLKPGTVGGTVQASLDFVELDVSDWARNVIGIIRGSDPRLATEYIAIGSHNDHVGFSGIPVDHDSAFAYQHAALLMSFAGTDAIRQLTAEERASIRVNVDSLRRVRPLRRDSINNGADDDGSGSMAMLEIAEAIALAPTKPRRSILLVWHTGEEAGLRGSAYFTANPTVPIEAIVAQINIDMIGRGRAEDLPGGGPDYLGVVGSNMLSTELGKAVVDVNRKQRQPLKLDYRFDEDVTATLGSSYNNIYRRSDHYNYARRGIPIAFFFTGLHADYHRVTDEPQYIDYPHYTRITSYINDLVIDLANRDARLTVDKPITDR